MAIEIKAIQCPKCGSTEKTELRLDHFRCESCGTEYFLDNGNTSIGSKPGIVDPRRGTPVNKGISPGCLIVIVVVCVVVIGAIALIAGVADSGSASHSSSAGSGSSREAPTWQYTEPFVYLSANNRPIVVATGVLTEYRNSGSLREPYLFFFDALKDSLIRRFQIPGRDQSNTSDSWGFRLFSNGDLYLETERTLLYKIDKAGYSIKDVTQTFAADEPGMSSGIAQVQFIYSDEDGFRVLTDDGKDLYYFPLIHKVYTQEKYWEARSGMKSLLPGALPATGFTFSARQMDALHGPVHLVKYRYMDNVGGPKESESFWLDEGKTQTIDHDRSRVLSFADFTPDRRYFEPKVLYSDSDYVLISYAPTAANKSRLVQCLDARTAAIVFTTPLNDSNLQEGTLRYKGGFALHYLDVYLIDMKGRVKHLKSDNNGS